MARGAVMARILIVEDQKKLLQSLQRGLQEEGYEVVTAATGEDGYYRATTEPFDAIILDLMLPGRSGLEVLRDLRAHGVAKPLLILTARDAVDDRVAGPDGGADDYPVKPFAFAEPLARLRALLRRDCSGRELVLRADDLEMDQGLRIKIANSRGLGEHAPRTTGRPAEITRPAFEGSSPCPAASPPPFRPTSKTSPTHASSGPASTP